MFIKAFHLETPLDLAAVLRFYRLALSKRGWSQNAAQSSSLMARDRLHDIRWAGAAPAHRQDDRTIAICRCASLPTEAPSCRCRAGQAVARQRHG